MSQIPVFLPCLQKTPPPLPFLSSIPPVYTALNNHRESSKNSGFPLSAPKRSALILEKLLPESAHSAKNYPFAIEEIAAKFADSRGKTGSMVCNNCSDFAALFALFLCISETLRYAFAFFFHSELGTLLPKLKTLQKYSQS